MLDRRRFLAGAAIAAGAGLAGFTGRGGPVATALAPPAEAAAGVTVQVHLVAAERPTALPCFAGRALPLWTFAEGTWPPVIRVNLGDRLDVLLDNRLPRPGEYTSIHWHGIRLPNDQDGVPYLVQPPVMPGESFRYGFVPPDTGTFFFHSHCNTAEQLGRGLLGVLIVDGDAAAPYAADEVILLHDWRVDLDAGAFRSFFTPRGAHRAGTYGELRSANGAAAGELPLPAAAACRLRLINSDATRIMEVAVEDADAAVIAIDGAAVPPFALKSWLLGPAMRVDLAVRAPAEGAVALLVDRRYDKVVPLARLVGTGTAAAAPPFDPLPLRAGRIPEPDLATADRLTFTFAEAAGAAAASADAENALALGPLCLSQETFWTINGRAWPGRDHARIPPPLAVLQRGRSYVFSLRNATSLLHPVHIHGHTFKVLRSDQRSLPVHHADTVLVLPDETVEVAFVADNPGRWMLHCHVIEHLETGMMGYVQVV